MCTLIGRAMKTEKGFTLIELMIAMVLGLFVIGTTITIYLLTVSNSTDTVKSARLNYDLDLAMTLMINDIRRSGYWGGAIADADVTLNPFMDATTRVQVLDSGECILYSYDADGDEVVDGTEYYGFKLDNGTVRMRLSGSTTADCSDGIWGTGEIIDGNQINITNLSFAPTYSCLNITNAASTIQASGSECTTGTDNVIELRQITITITGEIVNDTAVTKTISDTVVIRNNRIL